MAADTILRKGQNVPAEKALATVSAKIKQISGVYTVTGAGAIETFGATVGGTEVLPLSDTTLVSSGSQSNNYGTFATINNSSNNFGLAKASISSIGDEVTSAALRLKRKSGVSNVDGTLTINGLVAGNAGWSQGTKNNAAATAGDSTYLRQIYPDTLWVGGANVTIAANYYATAIATYAHLAADAATEPVVDIPLDLIALKAWYAAHGNAGFLFRNPTGRIDFYQHEGYAGSALVLSKSNPDAELIYIWHNHTSDLYLSRNTAGTSGEPIPAGGKYVLAYLGSSSQVYISVPVGVTLNYFYVGY